MSAPVEREWAVKWPEEDGLTPDDLVEVCDEEAHARRTADYYRARGVRLVPRTVTYGPWEETS